MVVASVILILSTPSFSEEERLTSIQAELVWHEMESHCFMNLKSNS